MSELIDSLEGVADDSVTFVERQNSDSEKWRKYAGRDVIPAWVADIDCAAAAPILRALHERVAHGVLGYTCPSDDLADAICAYFLRRWNWQIRPEWLVYSPGLGAGIHNSIRMADGGGVLTPQPIYHVFRTAPAVQGAVRLDMPMDYDNNSDGWQLSERAMNAAIKKHPAPRIFQLCNPHNPNGKVYTRDELLAIGEFCCRHDLLLFSDEVHADLILDEAPHIPIASLAPEIAARTITMQSPSKAFNVAGLNLAFIIIPNEKLRARYEQAGKGKVLKNLNPFGYAAARAAVSGECDGWLRALHTILRANRDALSAAVRELPNISMPHLAATYLAWLDVAPLQFGDAAASTSAAAHFVKHGLGMSPGADFGAPSYMRLNFGCSPARLQDIIDRLREAVNSAPANAATGAAPAVRD